MLADAAGQPARDLLLNRLNDAIVRALRRCEPAGYGFGLVVVLAAVAAFERTNYRQYELRPEPACQPCEGSAAPIRAQPAGFGADPIQLLAPELGVRFLNRGEAAAAAQAEASRSWRGSRRFCGRSGS